MSLTYIGNPGCCCGGGGGVISPGCLCVIPAAPLTCTWTYATNGTGGTNSLAVSLVHFPPPGPYTGPWTSDPFQLPGDYFGACGVEGFANMAGCWAKITFECRGVPTNYLLHCVPVANPSTGTICPQAASCISAFLNGSIGQASQTFTCSPFYVAFNTLMPTYDVWEVTYP